MAPARRTLRIKRIVLPLEGDETERELMELAGDLAAGLEAELAGLFIKTEDLLNLAGLPGTQTVISRTGARRELKPGEMAQSLDRLAHRAQRSLSELASSRRLRFSFETRTGRTEELIAGLRGGEELIALRRAPEPVLEEAGSRAPLLIAPHRLTPGRPVVALFEGSADLLRISAQLARQLDRRLIVAIAGETGDDTARFQRTARSWLTRQRVAAEVTLIDKDDAGAASNAVLALHPGLLVAQSGSPLSAHLVAAVRNNASALLLLPR